MNSTMANKKLWLQNIPLHPFFFASYPVLALLASNITQVYFSAGLRPLVISILMAGVLLLISFWIYRDWRQSGLVSSIILVLFYSYGYVYNLLTGINIDGHALFQHRFLIPLWLGLAILMVWWVSRGAKDFSLATYILNLVSLFLLIFPLAELTNYFVQRKISDASFERDTPALNLKIRSETPDIYYIILDGYGRADVLKKYGYDNSDFLNSLRGSGFFVADCAQSNYAQTQMSLASSLNFNYISALSDRFVPGSKDRTGLNTLIQHSTVRKSLEKAGYKTIGFATGFPMTELTDADYFLSPPRSWKELSEFESLLVKTTLAGLAQDNNSLDMSNSNPELFRERTLFTLDKLDKLSSIKGPKFVFVHLVIPHPPFVFGPTGGPATPVQAGMTRTQQIADHYRDQTIYISSRIMEIVPKIIANSTTPPIIVIQGDHGPTVPSGAQPRMKNLNVYFLPGVNPPLYSTITPVNTFRIIFNTYFGQNLELLDDVSLYSDYNKPFDYKVIPNSCQTNE